MLILFQYGVPRRIRTRLAPNKRDDRPHTAGCRCRHAEFMYVFTVRRDVGATDRTNRSLDETRPQVSATRDPQSPTTSGDDPRGPDRPVTAWRKKKAAQTARARRRKVDPSKAESAAKRAAKILTLKIEVFEHYCGGKPHCQCLGCPCDVIAFLQVDHKNGDGKNHVVNGHRMSGAELWSWIKRNNYPENFQILCGNCNNSKRDYAACKLYGTPHRG
jgi:hypothetical protein